MTLTAGYRDSTSAATTTTTAATTITTAAVPPTTAAAGPITAAVEAGSDPRSGDAGDVSTAAIYTQHSLQYGDDTGDARTTDSSETSDDRNARSTAG